MPKTKLYKSSVSVKEHEEITKSIKEVFKLKNDEDYAERIALKIVEMVKKGYKVYVSVRAAKILEPLLERYGIILVPTKTIEYPHILIDAPDENTMFIRFKDLELRKIEREISLEIFIKHLEKALKKYFEGKSKSKKKYIIEITSNN